MREKDSITVTEDREGQMAQAATVNQAYSLAGARRSAEEAAVVGQASLSQFDLAEMQKLYSAEEQSELLQRAQQQAESAADRRVEELKRREQVRASVVGGLAWAGPLDVTADTNLDDLAEDATRNLPWNLPILGPAAYGTVHVRKSWTEAEALEAACMLDWNVRTTPARWSTKRRAGQSGGSRSARSKNLIIRDPVDRYAERCRCSDYHGRPGEPEFIDVKGKAVRKEPCPWTVEWDLGMCYGDWKAEVQNEDLVGVLQAFAADGRFSPQSVLWLDGGTRVAIQMKLSESIFVLGADPHDLYLTVHNNFSGRGAAKVFASGVREMCDNTARWGEASAVAMGRAAHVGDVQRALREVGTAAMRAAGYMDAYGKDAEQLAKLELSIPDLHTLTDAVIEDKGRVQRQDRTFQGEYRSRTEFRRADLLGLLLADETVPPELRKTGYGALQTVNRWAANLGDKRTATSRLTAVWEPDGKAVVATKRARQAIQQIATRRVQTVRP
jgi:uncharacterized protein DUF932